MHNKASYFFNHYNSARGSALDRPAKKKRNMEIQSFPCTHWFLFPQFTQQRLFLPSFPPLSDTLSGS